jgi:two-component system alkaline phosphatase synthesis response regulator PhoP
LTGVLLILRLVMNPKMSIFSSNQNLLSDMKNIFQSEGFIVVTNASAGEAEVNALYSTNPDIILLDLDILNTDGIELCYRLTTENALSAFVVMFSVHFEDYIQVEAFKAGADDFIVFPINPRLFHKKILALLKRKPQNRIDSVPKILSYKNLKIDRNRYLITIDSTEISLPRKEFEILYLLLNNPQKVFSRAEIYQQVWHKDAGNKVRIIDVHIRKIRQKIGERLIKTVKGVGYQLA